MEYYLWRHTARLRNKHIQTIKQKLKMFLLSWLGSFSFLISTMCLFILSYLFRSTFSWLLIKWCPTALCTCSCSPCFNELAVLMNLGQISHHLRPPCQGCDRPYYALPFDDKSLWYIMYLHCWLCSFDFCTTLTINILSLSLSLSY